MTRMVWLPPPPVVETSPRDREIEALRRSQDGLADENADLRLASERMLLRVEYLNRLLDALEAVKDRVWQLAAQELAWSRVAELAWPGEIPPGEES